MQRKGREGEEKRKGREGEEIGNERGKGRLGIMLRLNLIIDSDTAL